MRRRAFIAALGGAAASSVSWQLAARAQERVRRIDVLFSGSSSPETQVRLRAFLQALQELGWTDGRNARIDVRWADGDASNTRKYVTQLSTSAPDVILALGSDATGVLLELIRSVPVVFALVPDPVGAGYVESMARPGGNATGFTPFEYGIGAKWLELLKEVAPHVTRAAIVRDPAISAGLGQWGAIQAAAPSLGFDVSPVNLRNAAEIERAVEAFARMANGGLIVTGSARSQIYRDLIVDLAIRHKLPAVYFERNFATHGGLMAYSPNFIDQFRRAADLHRPHPQGGEAGQPAGAGPDQVRTCH